MKSNHSNMKTVVISGSSSGIGRGLAMRLLQLDHYQVVGLARDHSKFNPNHQGYFPYEIDFADMEPLECNLQKIKNQHPHVDMLVCCAGIGQFAELEQFSAAQIQHVMTVNFTSQAVLIKTFLPLMKQKQHGKVIVLGSEAALIGAKKGSIYCASKFALRGFCQSLRQECRSAGISVTLINPGLVRTAFFDQLNFIPGPDTANAVDIADVVDALLLVINAPVHCVMEEINMQPLRAQVQKK